MCGSQPVANRDAYLQLLGNVEDCVAIDLDLRPPCEVMCTKLETPGAPDDLRTFMRAIYFDARGREPREVGRLVIYDGPLDAIGRRMLADSSTDVSVDRSTSPPTLELRSGSCLFDCNGSPNWAVDPAKPSDAACRASCKPTARYRYDGAQLQLVR